MIYYASRTGNVRHVAEKVLGLPSTEIEEGLVATEPFFVMMYTDGLGEVPDEVEAFLKIQTTGLLKGAIASGSTNHNSNYAKAADVVAKQYGVPIIRRIDIRGFESDYEAIRKAYKEIIEGCVIH